MKLIPIEMEFEENHDFIHNPLCKDTHRDCLWHDGSISKPGAWYTNLQGVGPFISKNGFFHKNHRADAAWQ